MTIYAIVNGLLSADAAPLAEEPVWTLISPSAILQGGNPYFVPDFDERFVATVALAVRIGKLGKGIAPRFAYRYVDSVAPAVVFIAEGKLAQIKDKGLPWTAALSYDRSMAVGRFTAVDFDSISRCDCKLVLKSPDMVLTAACGSAVSDLLLEDIIASISRDNTLKTGDILLLGLARGGPEVKPGGRAILTLYGEESIRFNIR